MPALVYGGVCYIVFLLTFSYAIGFVGNVFVAKSIDSGTPGPYAIAIAVDSALLGLFAIQHSVMARQGFKRWWTQFVPRPVERSTYVLLSSVALIVLFWQWRPIPEPVWTVTHPILVDLLWALFWLGWFIALLSTFLINHFQLLGLQQVWAHAHGATAGELRFQTPLLYKFVRHPLYFGFLLAFWATPVMSFGHLLFGIATTGYILVGIQLEERDLVTFLGDDYVRYQKRVSMLLPLPPKQD